MRFVFFLKGDSAFEKRGEGEKGCVFLRMGVVPWPLEKGERGPCLPLRIFVNIPFDNMVIFPGITKYPKVM